MTAKLKSIFLAAALAVTSVSAYTPPVSAASVTISSDGIVYRNRDRHHHRKRHWHKRHHRDCYVKKTKYRHHGRVIVKTVRVCR